MQALARLDDRQIREPSRLPGWDRLVIACHLRYGAIASERMTIDALAGRRTAFYPQGRSLQRPSTLLPNRGESNAEVVLSLTEACARLDRLWASIDNARWATTIQEPPENRDLGPITLWTSALLRLTEVEVHGHDLGLDLSPWSATFVEAALPTRLRWLPSRRSNHQAADESIDGSWALVVTDGPAFRIHAAGAEVEVEVVEAAPDVDAAITGPAGRLLAFILGRAPLDTLQVRGNLDHAAAFLKAFPAP